MWYDFFLFFFIDIKYLANFGRPQIIFSDFLVFLFQNQWSRVFCGIVSTAMTLDVLSTGVAGNYNGALQVVTINYILYLQ